MHITTSKLAGSARKSSARSFHDFDSVRKSLRGNEMARLGREGWIYFERRDLNVEPLGESPHQPAFSASDIQYAHSVADRTVAGRQIQLLRRGGVHNRVISLERCVEFKKVHCSLLLFRRRVDSAAQDLAVVRNAFPRRAGAPGETFCRSWNDANDLARAGRQVRFARFERKLLTRSIHQTHLLMEGDVKLVGIYQAYKRRHFASSFLAVRGKMSHTENLAR
jgi:hypothetical protein